MAEIVKLKSIYIYIRDNPKAKSALEAWVSVVGSCDWKNPQDIVETFGSKAVDILGKKDKKASSLSPERVVIDIKGNHIRVIAKYQFHEKLKKARLYIKWIGSHVEYDKLCSQNKQYEVEMFK